MSPTAQRVALAQWRGIAVCHSCHNAISPECCHCGDRLTDGPYNTFYHEGHTPTPMGCMCGYMDDKYRANPWMGVPDYGGDMDAMRSVLLSLTSKQQKEFTYLCCIRIAPAFGSHHQRDFAFLTAAPSVLLEITLRTLGLWVDEPEEKV